MPSLLIRHHHLWYLFQEPLLLHCISLTYFDCNSGLIKVKWEMGELNSATSRVVTECSIHYTNLPMVVMVGLEPTTLGLSNRNSDHWVTPHLLSTSYRADTQNRTEIPKLQIWHFTIKLWRHFIYKNTLLRKTLSKELGVSDVAISKHIKKLGLTKPPRGYWTKRCAPIGIWILTTDLEERDATITSLTLYHINQDGSYRVFAPTIPHSVCHSKLLWSIHIWLICFILHYMAI